MANLTENTLYGNTKTQPSIANLSNLTKNLHQTVQTQTSGTLKKSLDSHFNPSDYTSLYGLGKTPASSLPSQTDYTGPVGAPLVPQTSGTRTEALPTDYTQFVTSQPGDPWATPSDQAQLRNYPETMGGGQYVVDPTQPGALIKSYRSIMEPTVNPGAKQKILGKLSPKLYQVDHIIPLWAGGADTMGNLEIYDNITHQKKTAIQAVPLTLLANKKISLDEAKVMAFTWKDKDAEGLPTSKEIDDLGGYVPLKIAEEYAQKWKEGPGWSKFYGEAFKENMQNFGKNIPVVGEFSKGLVGGFTAGITPGTEASPESGKLGTVSNLAGNLLGMGIGLGKFRLGLKALTSIPSAIKAGFQGKNMLTAFRATKNVETLVKDATTLTPGILKPFLPGSVKLATGAAKVLPEVSRIRTVMESALKPLGLTFETGNISKAASTAALKWGGKVASGAGLFALWGQAGMLGREFTDPANETRLKDHIQKAGFDAMFGGLLGGAGQNVSGYASIGAGTLALSVMEGMDAKEALTNSALMMGLHTFGYANRTKTPMKIEMGNAELNKMARATLNEYTGDSIVPLYRTGEASSAVTFNPAKIDAIRLKEMKENPYDREFYKSIGPIKTEGDAINFITEKAKRTLLDQAALNEGNYSADQLQLEKDRIITAGRQLYKQTLPPAERMIEDWKDIKSMGEKLKSQIGEENVRTALRSTDILSGVRLKRLTTPSTRTPNLDYKTTRLVGEVPVTGHTTKIAPEERENLASLVADFQNNTPGNRKFSDTVILVKDDMTASLLRSVRNRQIARSGAGKPLPTDDISKIGIPENAVRVFAIRKVGRSNEAVAVGYVPRKARYDVTDPNNINKPFYEAEAEIKSGASTKANPFIKFSKDFNNDNFAKAMNRDGITWLTAKVEKAQLNPDGSNEPFLSVKTNAADIARDIKIQKAKPRAARAPGAIRAIRERTVGTTKPEITPLPEEFSSETGGVIRMTPETPQIPPVLAPAVAPEASLPTVATNVSKAIKTTPSATKPDLANDLFNEIVDRVENVKPNEGSAQANESQLMGIVRGFKRKNPGMSENAFKQAMNDAKGRATAYVQNLVDTSWKGTQVFGKDEMYARSKEKISQEYRDLADQGFSEAEITEMGIEKFAPITEAPLRTNSNEKLALEYGLQLKEPNAAGERYLLTDAKGEPAFTEEFKKTHDVGKQTPTEFWGSFLGNDLKALRGENSRISREWSDGLDKMKKSKDPYAKGFAEAMDTALAKKWGTNTRHWKDNWTANSALRSTSVFPTLRDSQKDLFAQTGQEGEFLSVPFRRVAARTLGKSYADVKQRVARADTATKEITKQAELDRLSRLGQEEIGKPANEQAYSAEDLAGMRVKDPNQVQNVLQDLTPFELMMNGLRNSEARAELVDRYNDIRKELSGGSAKSNPGIFTQMQLLFNQIKTLSVNIPEEVKAWKLGERIDLKNNGEPTFEEGMKDGMNVAAKMFQLKPSKGYVDFESVKKSIMDKLKKNQGKGGPYDGKGGLLGDMWGGIKNVINPKPTVYEASKPVIPPTPTYNVRGLQVTDKDLDEAANIIGLEISNRPGKDQFETHHIVNTAINRALTNPKQWGKTLTEVLQRPAQYQAYAPEGALDKMGKATTSRYQLLMQKKLDAAEMEKIKMVREYLNALKTQEFKDTTGGATYYVHASDGTLWLGKSIKEAKDNANKHEVEVKSKKTQWGGIRGMPIAMGEN